MVEQVRGPRESQSTHKLRAVSIVCNYLEDPALPRRTYWAVCLSGAVRAAFHHLLSVDLSLAGQPPLLFGVRLGVSNSDGRDHTYEQIPSICRSAVLFFSPQIVFSGRGVFLIPAGVACEGEPCWPRLPDACAIHLGLTRAASITPSRRVKHAISASYRINAS